jgi:hypothetical protein
MHSKRRRRVEFLDFMDRVTASFQTASFTLFSTTSVPIRGMARCASQREISFHTHERVLAQPGRGAVFDLARAVVKRRLVHKSQGARSAHRCLCQSLQRQSRALRLDQEKRPTTTFQKSAYHSAMIPGIRYFARADPYSNLNFLGGEDADSVRRACPRTEARSVVVRPPDRWADAKMTGGAPWPTPRRPYKVWGRDQPISKSARWSTAALAPDALLRPSCASSQSHPHATCWTRLPRIPVRCEYVSSSRRASARSSRYPASGGHVAVFLDRLKSTCRGRGAAA